MLLWSKYFLGDFDSVIQITKCADTHVVQLLHWCKMTQEKRGRRMMRRKKKRKGIEISGRITRETAARQLNCLEPKAHRGAVASMQSAWRPLAATGSPAQRRWQRESRWTLWDAGKLHQFITYKLYGGPIGIVQRRALILLSFPPTSPSSDSYGITQNPYNFGVYT